MYPIAMMINMPVYLEIKAINELMYLIEISFELMTSPCENHLVIRGRIFVDRPRLTFKKGTQGTKVVVFSSQ